MPSNIFRLTYASEATFKTNLQGGIESEVARILFQSRNNNSKRRIGGVLHYGEGKFFQCLEGEKSVVEATYQHIKTDPRHKNVKSLSSEIVEQRMFSNWSMKYVPIETVVAPIMQRHGVNSFNPYAFSQALINELLLACKLGHDPVAEIGEDLAEPEGKTRWWQRIWAK